MTESFVETQVRLVLERQCTEEFDRLRELVFPDVALTLVVFDFATTEPAGDVAFKTTLHVAQMVEAWDALISSWHRGLARPGPLVDGQEMKPGDLREIARAIRGRLPAGVGFALLIGLGFETAYVSNGERGDVEQLLTDELLPRWRADAERR